jgi:hypothetical protein
MNSDELLAAQAARLRARLVNNDNLGGWDWKTTDRGAEHKVGRGKVTVWSAPLAGYPGITYISSMGANSDDSFGGFLPGVTFEEAKLLVPAEWKKVTNHDHTMKGDHVLHPTMG